MKGHWFTLAGSCVASYDPDYDRDDQTRQADIRLTETLMDLVTGNGERDSSSED